jgi:hypothetical protein
MATETKFMAATGKTCTFRIEGRIHREQTEVQPGELKLMAYVFDRVGTFLGSAALDETGRYAVAVKLTQPTDVELLVGPADMPQQIRSSSAFRRKFAAKEWVVDREQFALTLNASLPVDVWRPWWPALMHVSGHVRKVHQEADITHISPVPFVKVEVFDVDRDFIMWPLLKKWWKLLLDRPFIRLPDLIKDPPIPVPPWPGPDPSPHLSLEPILTRAATQATLSQSPHLPSREDLYRMRGLNPQPEPPMFASGLRDLINSSEISPLNQQAFSRVGEAQLMNGTLASHFDKLTITSKVAPWQIFPLAFYSKAEICETTTDCNGYFNCSFKWWPFHFRRGRLRVDARPDIIIRVTQIIDGIPTVIYMDPYTSTRWNVYNAHIDLFLDDERVVCGPGGTVQPRPEGTTTFFTRVGNDYVFDIDQAAGTYHGGSLSNVAYGYGLYFHAVMGDGLTEATDPFYYRLSIGPGKGATAGPFMPITQSLSDVRVDKITDISETHALGPMVVNGQPALYRVRDTKRYYWYWPDLVGYWFTPTDVPDDGLYTVRLEVFDKNGVKLNSSVVDYRDGTKPPQLPPVPLPAMTDHCDLVLQIDNAVPSLTLDVPAAGSVCGVVKSKDLPFDINTSATQANGRLYWWRLHYVKGLSDTEVHLDSEPSDTTGAPAGLSPLPRNRSNGSEPFTDGLTTTCAFSLIADAWAHVRNGYGFVYHQRRVKAVAVEKST